MNAQENRTSSSFMRILVAEGDDIAAFVLQCELKKLDKAYSYKRVASAEEYLQSLGEFSPTLVIGSCKVLDPGLIAETRQRLPAARLIVVGAEADLELAEQSMKYGATDCLFSSQLSEIRLCLQDKPVPRKVKTVALPKTTPVQVLAKPAKATVSFLQAAWDDTVAIYRKITRNRKFARASEKPTSESRGISLGGVSERTKTALKMHWLHFGAFWTGARALLEAKFGNRVARRNGDPTLGIRPIPTISTANPGRVGSPRQSAGEPLISPLTADGVGRASGPETGRGTSNSNSETSERFPFTFPDTDNLVKYQLQSLTRELCQEIAAREQAESALEASDLSFKTLFESSLDAIFLLDGEGSILQANSAACVFLSSPISELSKQKFVDLLETSEKPLFQSQWSGFVQQGFMRGEQKFVLKGGRSKVVQYCVKANVWCGVHLMIARDITDRKRLSEELEQLRAALGKSMEAQSIQRRLLNDLEQRLSWFASSASKLGRETSSGEPAA
jgi:PAS domain S-box-containing protein